MIFVLQGVVNFKYILSRHPHNLAQLVFLTGCMNPAEQIKPVPFVSLNKYGVPTVGVAQLSSGPSSPVCHLYEL